jgi:hypothetical protein
MVAPKSNDGPAFIGWRKTHHWSQRVLEDGINRKYETFVFLKITLFECSMKHKLKCKLPPEFGILVVK